MWPFNGESSPSNIQKVNPLPRQCENGVKIEIFACLYQLQDISPFNNPLSTPLLIFTSLKKINFKIFLTFYITSTFYYYLNKKFTTIQFFF
jgi:hypothetical protein